MSRYRSGAKNQIVPHLNEDKQWHNVNGQSAAGCCFSKGSTNHLLEQKCQKHPTPHSAPRCPLRCQPRPSHFSTVICNKHLTRGNYKLQTIWPWSMEYGAALSHPMEAGSGRQGQHLLHWAYSGMGGVRLLETSGDSTWPGSLVDPQQCSPGGGGHGGKKTRTPRLREQQFHMQSVIICSLTPIIEVNTTSYWAVVEAALIWPLWYRSAI